jgi:hypothetical protein
MKPVKILFILCLSSLICGCAGTGKTRTPPPVDTYTNQPPGMQSYDYMYRSPPPPVAAALSGRR